jgi:alpha-amylase/alpha-mannosidase (GH57 family)
MDALRDRLIPVFESEASRYFKSPWDVRNDYIEVMLDRSRENEDGFLNKYATKGLSK